MSPLIWIPISIIYNSVLQPEKKKNRSTWPNLSTRGDRYVYLFRCGFFENTSTTLLTSSRKSSSDLLFVSRWWPPPPPPPPPVVVSVCRIPISLPQTSFGCPKFGVSRISGIFWVRGSWSMHRKAVIPRYPLGITSQRIFFFFFIISRYLQSDIFMSIFLWI